MTAHPMHRLGDLQLEILQVLWKVGRAGVAEVQQQLGDHLAYTTVATMLRKMEDRQLVCHQEAGRRFIYAAAVTSDEVSRSMSSRLVDRLFEGSLARTVSHLLETRDIDRRELAQLEELVHARRKANQGSLSSER
jgi:BlaI family penicillinase repressor